MVLCITGVNFKTAPIETREMLSFRQDEISEAYLLLLAKDEVLECVILSTCNRVEIYALLKEGRTSVLTDFIRDYHKFSKNIDTLIYNKTGPDAVRHLCQVASGLDSMVLGETQIFGQVKDAFSVAQNHGGVHHALDYLFTQVFSIVKRVRTKTQIGERNVSICYAVVKLATTIYKQISDKRVLILGAGEMGELMVRNLIAAGVKDVFVANRTFQKAVALAERFKGTPIMIHEIPEYLKGIDILISSVTVSEYAVKKEHLEHLEKNDNQIFIVDISVPRSIDPQVAAIENVHLHNIDDLQAVVDLNCEMRKTEAEKAKVIIESKINGIIDHLKSCDIIPTLLSIRAMAEEIRKDSILQTVDQQEFSVKEKELIDSMTKAIVNKILSHSEVKLREYSSAIKHT